MLCASTLAAAMLCASALAVAPRTFDAHIRLSRSIEQPVSSRPGHTLTEYMRLPVEQYCNIPLPMQGRLVRTAADNEFALSVPPISTCSALRTALADEPVCGSDASEPFGRLCCPRAASDGITLSARHCHKRA